MQHIHTLCQHHRVVYILPPFLAIHAIDDAHIGHVRLSYNPYFSACFFSRNSVFLSQQISRNSVSACFSAKRMRPMRSKTGEESSGKVVPLQYYLVSDSSKVVSDSVVVQRRRRESEMRRAAELCPRSLGSLTSLYALPSTLYL